MTVTLLYQKKYKPENFVYVVVKCTTMQNRPKKTLKTKMGVDFVLP